MNPVNGAVGLLSSGNWHVCQAAVETVFSGGVLRPMQGILMPKIDESSNTFVAVRAAATAETSWPSHYFQSVPSICDPNSTKGSSLPIMEKLINRRDSISLNSEESVMMTKSFGIGDRKERKLLNLFV